MVHYDITPSKQASLPRYLYHQATFRPAPVHSVNLAGQTAIVTGANSGVGFEASRQFLDLGLTRLKPKAPLLYKSLLSSLMEPNVNLAPLSKSGSSTFSSMALFCRLQSEQKRRWRDSTSLCRTPRWGSRPSVLSTQKRDTMRHFR